MAALLLERGTLEDVKPRTISGSPHLKLTDAGDYVRWRTSTVELTIDPSFEELGPGAKDAVVLAFDTWNAAEKHIPALQLQTPTTSARAERDGVNLVTYAPIEVPGYEHALGLTVAYSRSDGTILEADTIINSTQEFEVLAEDGVSGFDVAEQDQGASSVRAEVPGHDDGAAGRDDVAESRGAVEGGGRLGRGSSARRCVRSYDLQAVTTHEAGHFFGLGEDQDNAEATMFYETSRCETKKRDLSQDDIVAVQTVYAEAPPAEPPPSAGCAMAPTSDSLPRWVVLVSLLAGFGLITGRRCMRRSLGHAPTGLAR